MFLLDTTEKHQTLVSRMVGGGDINYIVQPWLELNPGGFDSVIVDSNFSKIALLAFRNSIEMFLYVRAFQ